MSEDLIVKLRKQLEPVDDKVLEDYGNGDTDAQFVLDVLQGWNAYAMMGNSYSLTRQLEFSTKSELEVKQLHFNISH